MPAQTGLIAVATVRTPDDTQRVVYCVKRPSRSEVNLLAALCEHVGRIISIDDICFRLRTTTNAVRIAACKLRGKLSEEWSIQSVSNKGMRLVFIADELSAAPRTHIEVNYGAVAVHRQHSEASRQKMRESAIAGKKHLHLLNRRNPRVAPRIIG